MTTLEQMKNSLQDNFPEYLIIHHAGGSDKNPLLDTSNQTFKIIQDYHISKGWENIGYHWVIEKTGNIVAGRPENYHGAHTSNYNNKSIGIVLCGNFDVTLPTTAQTESLRKLLKEKMVQYNIPIEKIVPHRTFANKTCYGNKIKDDWARNLIKDNNEVETLRAKLEAIKKIIEG